MSERPHAVLAWGFKVDDEYDEETEALFEECEIDEDGCVFENHGDQGLAYVCVKDYHYETDWDDVLTIDIKKFVEELPGKSARDLLELFCKKHKIPWQEPRWFLASYLF